MLWIMFSLNFMLPKLGLGTDQIVDILYAGPELTYAVLTVLGLKGLSYGVAIIQLLMKVLSIAS